MTNQSFSHTFYTDGTHFQSSNSQNIKSGKIIMQIFQPVLQQSLSSHHNLIAVPSYAKHFGRFALN